MTLLHIIVLAVVQGITEFLPISSSAHLILVPLVLDVPDQGLAADIAVHIGTLVAVMIYFRADVILMLGGLARLVRGDLADPGARMTLNVIIATIPIVIVAPFLKDWVEHGGRSLMVLGLSSIIWGVALYVVDQRCPQARAMGTDGRGLGFRDALIFGLAQIVAIIPGTSRSGITMTAGRLLGFDREASARFSMLISIPTILAAGLLLGLEIAEAKVPVLTADTGLAALLACVTALVAIAALMGWLKRASFTIFVVYRVLLGLILVGVSLAA
ncbi:undecaprenyl-diphosphate phosphatase [Tistrella bauzanensis]|uniref:Undecaprenyl-diphosphatase n=1 Tax=Tistrella arctica TaxID=3133430 RepID=A0ABU9YKB3_9PROT